MKDCKNLFNRLLFCAEKVLLYSTRRTTGSRLTRNSIIQQNDLLKEQRNRIRKALQETILPKKNKTKCK